MIKASIRPMAELLAQNMVILEFDAQTNSLTKLFEG